MAILLVDLGNSRLKWALSADDRPLTSTGVSYRGQTFADVFVSQWGTLARPERVLIASVAEAGARQTLQQWIRSQWSLEPEFLVSPTQALGIRNAYVDTASLGCDRWAAMVAAYHLAGAGVCVVDCGTAVTLDVVTADGQHHGGLILPGLTAMQTGLSQHTRLPLVDFAVTTDSLLGCATAEAIALGAIRALVALVDQTMTAVAEAYREEVACYLTGGDAGYIGPRLAGPCQLVPDLVLQGLAMIARDT